MEEILVTSIYLSDPTHRVLASVSVLGGGALNLFLFTGRFANLMKV